MTGVSREKRGVRGGGKAAASHPSPYYQCNAVISNEAKRNEKSPTTGARDDVLLIRSGLFNP